MAERFNSTLMENVITLLCHDDVHGKVVANLINPDLFEGEYRIIAERSVEYWNKFQEAPKLHTADLVAEILEDPHNRKAGTYRRILSNMLELSEHVNVNYVLGQVRMFMRMQRFKDAIVKSAERLNSQQEMAIDEVEGMWNDLLRVRQEEFEKGMVLRDVDRLVDFLDRQYTEFSTGIRELDSRYIVPARGTTFLFLAPAGWGKTWFLITLGKQALLRRMKVLHLSLEISEEEVAQRYYQSILSVPKRQQDLSVTTFQFDRFDKIDGFGSEVVHPEFTFDSPSLREELMQRANYMGTKLDNLIIKRFTPRSLNARKLNAFLDNLEIAEKFIPDLLILDYIGITETDAKNHRISLGRSFEDFRGICVERNIAGATASQTSKASASAFQVSAEHVAEDWSLIGTTDICVTMSATKAERAFELARLFIAKARMEKDKFGLLITQKYDIGQFCLESAYLGDWYKKLMESIKADTDDEVENSNEDED